MPFDPQERIARTAGAPVRGLAPVGQGLSDSLKFKARINGRFWMAKITRGTPKRALWYKELSELRGDGLMVPEQIHLFDDGMLCLLTPWVEGVSLEEKLETATGEEIRGYAAQAADRLRRLHQKSFPDAACAYRACLAQRVERACRGMEDGCLTFAHAAECARYLRKAARERDCGDPCLVHMDIRPENFLLRGGRLYLIDFDNGGLGEPAGDFAYLTTLEPAQRRRFARHTLEAYWNGAPSARFWQDNLLYSTLQVLEYALWKYKERNRQAVAQPENLWRQYDGFTNCVPAWWRTGEGRL